ncbi:bleomycin hydrolase isoform X1 [Amyelois transitella]|uniref:bleomycin hydrolase isoform X1 n=1 Tax=Amyelois transitella TaxID=680683 RepID=UPI002990362E|nr:bleomycin hydrolase isoform X1 [Amyelois transitella]
MLVNKIIRSAFLYCKTSYLLKISSAAMSSKPLTIDLLGKLRNEYYSDPKNELAQNVCTRFDPFEVAISRKKTDGAFHVYNIKVESEGKPVTNQENSGRCWLFAALNVMRLPFMKKYAIEEFEFSQSYLFFWDKIERSHYWLNNIVETAKAGEELEGRLVNFLLKDPINDGGQWDMIVNLVNKYGVMPKKCYPESFSSKKSMHMNAIIKTKLREYAKELRDMVAAKASDEFIQKAINKQMAVIFNIVATCLGTPPEKFTFEFYNKEKAYNNFGALTPQEFYEQHVRPLFNVNDKVCLVSDPRQSNPFGNLYTLQCLGNVVGGRRTAYNNQPIETLMNVVKDSIQGGEAVWFGCEVSKRFERKNGLEDLDAHDYRLVFNTEVQIGLQKADRLMYGDSCMTHAMVFTAVGTNEQGKPYKFRVENSYSDKEYDKGYLMLTEPWFREFVFEVVVDKKFVPKEVLEVFQQEPKVLPAWDPMGTLACPYCSRE